VSKRDEDSQPNEMEVGMTTAERRRRRRRGAGLRVPSDNVPRSRTPSTAPPPPVPEDPALAMSIAYSFRSDESGPVPRAIGRESSEPSRMDPIAPDAMPTVIDPPSGPVVEQDFEMKTREMSAVDLQALGLADEPGAGSTLRMERISTPSIDVDVSIDGDPTEIRTAPVAALQAEKKPQFQARHKTVALSEEDLEEVRAQTSPSNRAQTSPATPTSRAQTNPVAPPPTTPASVTSKPPATTKPPPMGVPRSESPANKTQPLVAADVEVLEKRPISEEPMSVPDIDIQELAEKAGESGEIAIDVDEDSRPNQLPNAAAPAERPARQSQPPAIAQPDRKSGVIEPASAQAAHPHPPPPPAAHKAPPSPPPASAKKGPPAAVVAAVTKEPSRPTRSKPWFVDLFDEDYLRTLPFLTPQATQAEAEFVIESMNLAPGAQVLDLGCGYGRHAMELAARGFHVVGLDISTPLLVRGGEEAHRRGLTINFVRGDMRELDFENQFDACYCLFSTFGYFDDETNKKTLANVQRALKPGGKILVEILNRDYVIADLPTRVWWEGDGCVVLEEVELNYFSSRIQVNRSVVFDDGRQVEQEISVRAYSLHEVGKLMHLAGFRVLEVSGGYQTRGRFFGNQSRHIIVLAERKEPSGT
jgi:SAM-dependent methyltransferase